MFKVGDRVVCVDTGNITANILYVDRVYIVLGVAKFGNIQKLHINNNSKVF